MWCDKVDLVSATFTRSWTSPEPQVEKPIPPLPFGAKSPGKFWLVYWKTNHLLWYLDLMVTPVSSVLNSQRICHQRLWATESALCCTHPKSKICITNDWHHSLVSKYFIFSEKLGSKIICQKPVKLLGPTMSNNQLKCQQSSFSVDGPPTMSK